VAYVWTFRDGKVIHFRSYRDPDEAKNAGLAGAALLRPARNHGRPATSSSRT
jgi:hypothetical protein